MLTVTCLDRSHDYQNNIDDDDGKNEQKAYSDKA